MEKKIKKNAVFETSLILLLVAFLIFSPLILKPEGGFAGTDDSAKIVIGEIKKDYVPWFKPIWEPPSKEVESLIFSLQASIGSAIIAFYLGYLYGKNKKP